jgi:DNA-binding transcriptional regulator YiaG
VPVLSETHEDALRALSTAVAARRALPEPQVCKLLRTTAGVSLAEVAKAVGVSKQAVWTWEEGTRRPTGARLERYLAVLDTLRGAPT